MSARDVITARIRDRGPITVADFIAIALYHPEHGYYSRAARRTGRNGDFFTSVDVGPIFGALLGRQFAEMWRRLGDAGPCDLVEAAAANGQLARDVLDWAQAHDPEFYRAIRLHLVEASPAARAAQREMLAAHAASVASSGARLPDTVHRVVMTEHGLRELFIDLAPDGRLIERAGQPSTDALERYLAAAGVRLEPGWRAEINLAALAWLARAAAALHRGYLVLIDYGHEAPELYSAAHAAGTLTSFHRHLADRRPAAAADRMGPAWLDEPGAHDVTSHVDLTSVRQTAEGLGLTTLGLLDQTYFLLALGLAEVLDGAGGGMPELRQRLALKTLLLPGGLGSTHKVMVFGRNVEGPPLLGLSGLRRLT